MDDYTNEQRMADFEWYKENLAKLYRRYGDRYVAIKNKTIIGVYDKSSEASEKTNAYQKPGTYIIQKLGPDESAYTATLATQMITILSEMEAEDFAWAKENLDELYRLFGDCHALVHNRRVIGTYLTHHDAVVAAEEKPFGNECTVIRLQSGPEVDVRKKYGIRDQYMMCTCAERDEASVSVNFTLAEMNLLEKMASEEGMLVTRFIHDTMRAMIDNHEYKPSSDIVIECP